MKKLIASIEQLALLSHRCFPSNVPIKFFSQPITGKIILSGAVVEGVIEQPGIAKVWQSQPQPDNFGGIQISVAGPLQPKIKKSYDDLFQIESADLYGIEFRLYDGRNLYEGDDRISFVFLRSQAFPTLDGRLVYVEDRDECRHYDHELIKEADWFLTEPHIHLRYYCEEWLDSLLAWVKFFFIPDLYFWRYEPLPGYAKMANYLDENRDEKMKKIMFRWLMESFCQEVEKWRGTADEVLQFWASVLKAQKERTGDENL